MAIWLMTLHVKVLKELNSISGTHTHTHVHVPQVT